MSEPTLEIQIGPRGSAPAFRIKNALGDFVDFGDRNKLDEQMLEQPLLRNWLEELVTAAGPARDLDMATANDVVARMHKIGLSIILEMVQSDMSLTSRLEQVTERGLASRVGDGLPSVQIVAPNDDDFANTFPFEILPLFNLKLRPNIVDHPSLEAAMSAFLGYSAMIERSSFQRPSALNLSTVDGQLPVAFFHYADLPAAGAEYSYLQARPDVNVVGLYPAENHVDEKDHIAERIANAGRLVDRDDDLGDQVHHFSCHCETNSAVRSHFITLKPNDGTKFDMDLKDLLTSTYKYRIGGGDRPLVIFNNCGGAAVDPRQIGSFLHFFSQHNGNRGFIGLQARLPDRLASAFSSTFYELVLRKRQKVGEALANTRRQLVMRHFNPLAILYAYYGSPELAVRAA